MHNWWIAALVKSGVWTEEQAQHVSDNIKTTIHKDNFHEALNELDAIFSKEEAKFGVPTVAKLEAEVESLKSKVSVLTEHLATKVEAEVSKTPAKTPVAKVTKTI
jgi:polyhydroxyalkanoate synthesis regulator phasin